ncbi:rod shape-determining protein [Blastococcus sp. TML/M2B]|uniref:rod shape-determining protein n=1 Tax=unclassified Blastococcus TaxID=2619396 RepID=UPI00190D1B36|nr:MULTISPECIES: rod shape-determining protein [unclassified Blastococcus]MBN1092864.1 rod shape-determining protein [Blastococcus sp. TML/M2B]MBN1097027.1 rod shape-determining protein [Blastococcus sp. TML/C7B]
MDLGIDLGTATTVVSDLRRGIVFDEPSVLLLRPGSGRRPRITAVGREAGELVGRAPARFSAVRPLHDGVVTDLETARLYLRAVLARAGRRLWSPVRAVIGVPADATSLETRALLEAAEEAGIRPATALDDAVAGAVGCGLDPLERRVHLVVDIGGGSAAAVAFCYGGVLAQRTSKVGGDEMTGAVARYLREEHQLSIGELEAERVKTSPTADAGPLVVHGRDGGTGRPRLVTVQPGEIGTAVRPVVDEIVRALSGCLDDLPPQALADVLAEGVLVFGGASLVPGLPQQLENALGLPVKLAEEPLTCVAEGAARALRNRPLLAAYGRG